MEIQIISMDLIRNTNTISTNKIANTKCLINLRQFSHLITVATLGDSLIIPECADEEKRLTLPHIRELACNIAGI